MAIILDGNIGVTYPDVTTQNTSAVIGGKLPTTRLPAGSVLQVVNGTTTTTTSTSGTTLIDTNLSASITPTSATSKILVLVNHYECAVVTALTGIKFQLLRGATAIGTNYSTSSVGYGAQTENYFNVSMMVLDSPATTSSTTYKTQFARISGSGTVYVQVDSTLSTITLMEIAA